MLIAFTGEQWRFGGVHSTIADKMDFQISFDATSLSTGTWTDVNALDFNSVITAGTAGALDGNAAANRAALSATLTGLSIANGASFWIRLVDVDATAGDDGLAIDDFSITGTAIITNGALSIADLTQDEGSNGINTFTFTVTRSGGSTGAVGATWTLANGTTDGLDFVIPTQSGTVEFADGETNKTVTILVEGDTTIESSETFFVNLTSPTGGATISDGQGLGTILNDDFPPVGTLAINDITINEGDSGATSFEFTIFRTGGTAGAVSADWALDLSGTANAADFTGVPQSGTVSFVDGQTSATVTVTVAGDAAFEASETFFVNLSNPTGGASISDAQGQATIVNDDAAPPIGTLSIGDVSLAEGNSGSSNLTFTVTRASGSFGAVGATWALTNGTTNAADFGTPTFTGTVSFADGQTTATISIPVAGDTTFEPNETFTVTLSAPTGGVTITDAAGVGTIINDDAAPPLANVWINEFHYDNAGTDANEFIEVAGLAGTNLTGWSLVLYNGNGGASYSTLSLSGALADSTNGFGFAKVLAPGIQNGSPDGIALVDNFGRVVQFLSYEGAMTATNGPASGLTSTDVGVEQSSAAIGFTLQLQGTGSSYADFTWAANVANTEGAVNAGQSFLSGTDQGQIRIGDASVTEGNSGTANLTFTVSRAGGFAGAASVDYQVLLNGTADAADLDGGAVLAGTVSFAAGEFSRTITIPVLGDVVGEFNETLSVQLSNVTGNAVIADASAIGTIVNDDPLPLSIMQIQGAGHTSAYVGQTVLTTGIVTAVDTNGFYLQDPTGDGNTATSDAVFVFTGTAPTVAIGDGVSVSAQVAEFVSGAGLSLTQLTPTLVTIDSTGNALPAAVLIGTGGLLPPTATIENDGFATFDPANDGIDFWESLEGMRVTIDNPLVVSNTNSFGETDVVASLGVGASGVNSRGGITISGGDFNPEKIQIDDRFGALIGYTPNHSIGDHLASVTGVLNYSFLNYEVLATSAVTVTQDVTLADEQTALTADVNYLTIATYNLENMDPSDNKYDILGHDIVYSLRAPDIVAVQEVQDADGAGTGSNLSGVSNVQGLIDAIFAESGIVYTYVEIAPDVANSTGGEPNGNIRNGYLYRADHVALVSGSLALLTDSAFNGSRKPLVATWLFHGEEVTTINVHFTSRGGSDPLWGATQPPVDAGDAARTAQAGAVGTYVNNQLATDPTHQYMILGDWNGFYFETAQTQLTSGGVFTNLAEALLPSEERYSYVFEGNSQLIDNLLVTGGLLTGASIDAVHLNAEFGAVGRPTDHDPQVSRLLVGPAPTGFVLTNDTVDENQPAGTVVGSLKAYDPDDTLTYSLTDDAGGLFTINASTGEITTTAPFNFEALASYTIAGRATDSSGRFVASGFTINVGNVNEAPTAVADPAAVNEDATSANLWSLLLGNDTDPDTGTTLAIASVNTTGTLGSVLFDANTQTLQYVANNNAFDELAPGATATDTFTYTVSDGNGGTSTATVTITITGLDDGLIVKGTIDADALGGTAGEDELYGRGGDDQLKGRDGHDWLQGGRGNDKLTGGTGLDSFVFAAKDGDDVIRDFSKTDDRLVLLDGLQVAGSTAFDYNNDGFTDLKIDFTGGGSVTLLGISSIAGVRIDSQSPASPPSDIGHWTDFTRPPVAANDLGEKGAGASASEGWSETYNLAMDSPVDLAHGF
jgi:VCBS repeat-containing protein